LPLRSTSQGRRRRTPESGDFRHQPNSLRLARIIDDTVEGLTVVVEGSAWKPGADPSSSTAPFSTTPTSRPDEGHHAQDDEDTRRPGSSGTGSSILVNPAMTLAAVSRS